MVARTALLTHERRTDLLDDAAKERNDIIRWPTDDQLMVEVVIVKVQEAATRCGRPAHAVIDGNEAHRTIAAIPPHHGANIRKANPIQSESA